MLSKDADFPVLLARKGPPPQVVWITLGNCSNQRLRDVLERRWDGIAGALAAGEPLVELGESARA